METQKVLFISTKHHNNCIKVIFLDNGGGIKDDIMEKIFEPYFTTKHQSQGTGIGLYMTKQIIEKQSNGTIEVSNKTFQHNQQTYTGAEFKIIFQIETK